MSVRLSITARTRSLPSLFAFAESLASLSRVDSPPSKTIDTCRRVAPFPKVSKSKPSSDSSFLDEIECFVGAQEELVLRQGPEGFLSELHEFLGFFQVDFVLGEEG